MSTLRQKMLQYMQQKNYSTKTINSYITSISVFSHYFNLSPEKISMQQINDYLHYCITQKHLSASTINIIISSIRVLHVYVLHRKWNPIDFPRPKREKRLPVVLSAEEVALIINKTTNTKHKTVLMLAYSCGLRLCEVQHLTPQDIDSKRMQINIRKGKGNKDRTIMLSEILLLQLRRYWTIYRPKTYLIEGMTPGKAISERTLQYVMKHGLRKAAINKDACFHSLRHSFATHLIEQGMEIVILQRLLGHSKLATTSGYLHLQHYNVNKVQSPIEHLALD